MSIALHMCRHSKLFAIELKIYDDKRYFPYRYHTNAVELIYNLEDHLK